MIYIILSNALWSYIFGYSLLNICFEFGEYVGQLKVHESLYLHVLYIIFVIGFGQSQLCPYEASGKL